jgi:hypothetical protein
MQMTLTIRADDVWQFARLLKAEGAREATEAETSPPGACQDERLARVEAVQRLMAQVATLTPGEPLELAATDSEERLMLTSTADAMVAEVAKGPSRLDVTDYAGLTAAADQITEWAELAERLDVFYEAAEAAERAAV